MSLNIKQEWQLTNLLNDCSIDQLKALCANIPHLIEAKARFETMQPCDEAQLPAYHGRIAFEYDGGRVEFENGKLAKGNRRA